MTDKSIDKREESCEYSARLPQSMTDRSTNFSYFGQRLVDLVDPHSGDKVLA